MKTKNLILILITFISLAVKAQNPVCFANSTNIGLISGTFPIGNNTYHDTVDLNNDGFNDVVTSNFGNYDLIVNLANGSIITVNTAANHIFLVIHNDFNGDGKMDLAILESPGGIINDIIFILLGIGDGSFQAPYQLNNQFSYQNGSIMTDDYNGDGKPDIAISGNINKLLLNTIPFISIATAKDTICSGESLTLTASGAASYSWSTGATTNPISISPLLTTTYNITGITSACSNTATKTIAVNQLPISNAGSDLTICSGIIDSIGSTAVTGYSYSWNTSIGLNDSTVSFPVNTTINGTSSPVSTTYTVTTTETETGCQSTDSVIVIVNPQPELSITNPAAECFPNEVDITAAGVTAGSTGGGTLSYWKDTGATISLSSPNAIVISDTNFIKVIAVGGCVDIDTVTVVINPLPISNAGSDLSLCSGLFDTIGSASLNGHSYSWAPNLSLSDSTISNPIDTTINSSNLPIATTYTVTTTITETGCQSTDSILVTINPQPILNITSPNAVCFPNTIDLTSPLITIGSTGGGALSYWKDAGATISLSSPNAIAISDTNYIKVIAVGGCTDIDSVITTINPLPISNAGNDLTICSGIIDNIGSTTVTGYSYLWNTSIGLNDSTISNPTNTTINNTNLPITITYIVTTTIVSTGCNSTDTATIIINPQPILLITNPTTVCFPNTVDLTLPNITLGSTGGGTLSYYTDFLTTNTIALPDSVIESDTCFIKVIATGGCVDVDTVIVTINSQPTATFTTLNESSSLYCDGSIKANLTGGTGTILLSWNTTPPQTTDSIGALCNGTYTLNLIDSNNCTNTLTQTIQAGQLPPTPSVCLITVDESNTHNLVVWEKTNLNMVVIDSFIVYREITTNNYARIGSVSGDSLSTFDDFLSNPSSTGYRYRLKSKNTQGATSLESEYHNSIYLSNTGATFSWTPYQVENNTTPVASYNVYRDDNSTGNFQSIGNTTGNQFGYTDVDFASFPNASYYVDAVMSTGVCGPSRSDFSASRSNIRYVGSNAISVLNINVAIKVFPNPATNIINIAGITDNTKVRLYDMVGRLVVEKEVDENTTIYIDQMTNGVYSILTESKNGVTINKIVINH